MRSFQLWSRLLLLLLALSMVLTAFAACATEDDGDDYQPQDTGDGNVTIDPNEGLYDEDGYLLDQLPDDLDYQNKELTVLCFASPANEFGCDNTNGTPINDALVRRDINVEERLGVNLQYLTDLASSSITEVTHYVELVRTASEANTPYDLMALYGRTAAVLSSRGYLQNILDIDYSHLNFENPWWTQNLMDELVVGKSLYIISGDITPSLYEQAYTLFYNVDMVKDFQVKDPYDHVKENTWTMETFRSTIKDVTVNQNGSQAYGFVSNYYTIPAMLHGCGVRITEMDENHTPRLSDGLFSERTIDIVDDLQAWSREDNFLVDKGSAVPRKHFVDGNAMFSADIIIECFNFVESCEFAYSVVPTPKLTQEQDRYYTTLSGFTFFCLMKGLSQEELTIRSAVLECMCSEGYRLTSPAVLDTCLKSRYAQTEEMSEMLSLIMDSVYYDFGRIYSSSDDKFICDRVGLVIASSTETWSSYKNANKTMLENRFNTLVETFLALEGQ